MDFTQTTSILKRVYLFSLVTYGVAVATLFSYDMSAGGSLGDSIIGFFFSGNMDTRLVFFLFTQIIAGVLPTIYGLSKFIQHNSMIYALRKFVAVGLTIIVINSLLVVTQQCFIVRGNNCRFSLNVGFFAAMTSIFVTFGFICFLIAVFVARKKILTKTSDGGERL